VVDMTVLVLLRSQLEFRRSMDWRLPRVILLPKL